MLNRKRGIHAAPKRKNFISGLEVMVTRPRSDTIDQLLRTSKLQRSLTVGIFLDERDNRDIGVVEASMDDIVLEQVAGMVVLQKNPIVKPSG